MRCLRICALRQDIGVGFEEEGGCMRQRLIGNGLKTGPEMGGDSVIVGLKTIGKKEGSDVGVEA